MDLAEPEDAALARLLGQAAALITVVGRTEPPSPRGPGVVLFDDGDAVVVEGSHGLPRKVILTDHGGTFADYHALVAHLWRGVRRTPEPSLGSGPKSPAVQRPHQRHHADLHHVAG
jgi:hypothetical protein